MHRFEVWAPRAEKLSLKLTDAKLAMDGPDAQGWWRLDVAEANPGADYAYCIDDDATPYPDPRSLWQAEGVHAMSRLYDQSAFEWNDAGFQPVPLPDSILYELHIGTLSPEGTLDAAIGRLNYLAELGVTHIELMPVAAFAGDRGWGYDGVALFAVHQPYGGPDALKRFVDAAHKTGLAVLLDVVYNHFGPVGNYSGKYGPYITEAHRTPWGGAVNLEEAGSHHVRRFFCDNAIMWMRDYHIDGLRLDAVHAFVDRTAIHFLEQLSAETETLSAELRRPLTLIAESDLNDPRVVTPRESGGLGMDAQWSDDFHHALVTVLNPNEVNGYYGDFGRLDQLAKAFRDSFVYDGIFSEYRNRIHGRPAAAVPQYKFIGFVQNHDQIGNRAIGDRLAQIVWLDRAKIAAALVLLGPFTPMLFQGEEWAASTPFQYFADHEDPAMARLVSEGRKAEFAAFGWAPDSIPDPESPATFERSKLKWDEQKMTPHKEMLAWYRSLIQLRRSQTRSGLGNGEPVEVDWREDRQWLSIACDQLMVICNLNSSAQHFPILKDWQLLLASRDGWRREEDQIDLPGESVIVLQTRALP
jgi:maltooligosyltrehalose trehalohydrolase